MDYSTDGKKNSAAVPGEPARDLQQELSFRFQPFAALFGSVAAISAFLLFAGFLSDFGAYRMAGLPRLSFSFTALVETGSDVAVDVLSLLAQGTRAFWLVLLIAVVVMAWSASRHPAMSRWARSHRLYRLCRLVLLLLSFVVFASLVDRTQRSLAGEMYTAAAVERGLTEAYDDGFPNPYERQRAIDRQGYELRFFRLPNWAVKEEAGWRWLKSWVPWFDVDRLDTNESGIVLRGLPESRRDARHVFGWLALTMFALILSGVLLQWWREALRATTPSDPGRSALLRGLDGNMDPALDRLVGPLTVLLLAISTLLLPLAHGVLAKKSLGGEHVMVYLKGSDIASTEEISTDTEGKTTAIKRERAFLHPEPSQLTWPAGRYDCGNDMSSTLDEPMSEHNSALLKLTQERKSDTDTHGEAFIAYIARLDNVASKVIGLNCAEAVRQFWVIKPPPGLAAQEPEIAEGYRRAAARVATAYGLRIGTILTYPRDTQPLTLVDSIVPRSTTQSPIWSLQALDASVVGESVVLPDLFRRGTQSVGEILHVEPDSDALAELLVAPSSEALEVVLPLLRDGRLFSNGRNVSVTSMGSMAWVSAVDKPNLSRDAINLLADLTDTNPSAFWPAKDERVRGAAVTALHLTRSPYAGHLLGRQVTAAGPAGCAKVKSGAQVPIACVPQSSTAAGYLLQDVAAEARRFSSASHVPSSLRAARRSLENFISELLTSDGVADDIRGAACTSIGLAGGISIDDEKRRKIFLDRLTLEHVGAFPFSSGACLMHAHRVGVPEAELRPVLRSVALAQQVPGYSVGETKRIRYSAFLALVDMGMSGETDFIMQLYLNEPEDSKLAKAVRGQISEISEGPMTRFIMDCARSESRSLQDRQRCLKAFEYAKDNVDGDHLSSDMMVDMLRSDAEPEPLKTAACHALRVFKERGGRIVMRLESADDPVLVGCLKSQLPGATPEQGVDDDKLREMLRRLLEDSKTPSQKVPDARAGSVPKT